MRPFELIGKHSNIAVDNQDLRSCLVGEVYDDRVEGISVLQLLPDECTRRIECGDGVMLDIEDGSTILICNESKGGGGDGHIMPSSEEGIVAGMRVGLAAGTPIVKDNAWASADHPVAR
jgi:hypothetical protein